MTRMTTGVDHMTVTGPASMPHMRDWAQAMMPYVRRDDRAQGASANPVEALPWDREWVMYYATPAFADLYQELARTWDDEEFVVMLNDIARHLGDADEYRMFMGFDRRNRPWLTLDRGAYHRALPHFDLEPGDNAIEDPEHDRYAQQVDAVALGWSRLPDELIERWHRDPGFRKMVALKDEEARDPWCASAVAWLNNGVVRTGVGNSRTVRLAILLAWIMVNPEPNLVTVVERAAAAGIPPRARTGSKRDQKARVKVVDLRRQTVRTIGEVTEARRTLNHRFIVRGHWRKQAFGPGRRDRKMVYIAPFVKGPADAPFVERESVFRW
jgi:hypothetical protein